MTKVWIVTDCDYDSTRTVAVYLTEALANEHVNLMGGYVEEVEVRSVIHPDAVDPMKQAERAEELEKSRQEWECHRREQETSAKQRAEMRPSANMGLCHCRTFSANDYFINEHGYCSYCGGFTPSVFREHKGEAALQTEIDKLAEYDREKMRATVASK